MNHGSTGDFRTETARWIFLQTFQNLMCSQINELSNFDHSTTSFLSSIFEVKLSFLVTSFKKIANRVQNHKNSF